MKKVNDTDDLYLKRVQVRLGIEPAKGGYSAKNNVIAYLPVASPPPQAQEKNAEASPPWA